MGSSASGHQYSSGTGLGFVGFGTVNSGAAAGAASSAAAAAAHEAARLCPRFAFDAIVVYSMDGGGAIPKRVTQKMLIEKLRSLNAQDRIYVWEFLERITCSPSPPPDRSAVPIFADRGSSEC